MAPPRARRGRQCGVCLIGSCDKCATALLRGLDSETMASVAKTVVDRQLPGADGGRSSLSGAYVQLSPQARNGAARAKRNVTPAGTGALRVGAAAT